MSLPECGEPAPDFHVRDALDRPLHLAEFRGRPVALIFLRHMGCPICRSELAALSRRIAEFRARAAEVVVVVESPRQSVAEYVRTREPSFRIVPDPERMLYRLYGVDRGGLGAFLAPGAALRALRATASGHFHGRFEGHELQLPADFVIDRHGTISFVHGGRHIGDNTPLDVLLQNLP